MEWDFVYDNAGTLVGAARDDIYQAKYKYDAAGRLTALMRTADGNSRYTGFAYNKFGQAANVKITGSSAEINEANTFDTLGRLTEKRWTKGSDQAFAEYTYKAGTAANSTSTQLDTVEFGSGESTVDAGRKYLYDNVGNIIEEQHLVNGNYTGKIRYTYDAASQLIRVDDAVNNQTVQYTYDTQGNITTRTYHAYTTGTPGTATRTDTWTYGGPDGNTLLTSFIAGTTTSYNHPHYGLPDSWTGGRTLTWRNGRTLASIGNTSFTYDGEGQRVSKTTGNVITEYIYEGDKLVMQKQGTTALFFLYDTSGIFGFDLITNGSTTGTYYYRTDGKGEIIALTDAAGNVVANYTYDAWGTPTGITDANGTAITGNTHIGIINPIRYKGYCYDTETGLYYLNSRYYDPEVCRFVNADELLSTGQEILGFNMFAYCLNNPLKYSDDSGMRAHPNTIAVNDGGSIYTPPIKKIFSKVRATVNDTVEYITNDDERKALDSGPLSFYKGVPVVHLPCNVAPFSMGIIFLGSKTSEQYDAIETLQHEYGHSVHLSLIGPSSYLTTVVIPSVVCYPFVEYDQYYSQPWEYVAEILGGVTTRTNSCGQPYQYSVNAEVIKPYWTYTIRSS